MGQQNMIRRVQYYPVEMYDDHDTVLICPALTTMTNRCVPLTISNMSSLQYKVPKNTHLATFASDDAT